LSGAVRARADGEPARASHAGFAWTIALSLAVVAGTLLRLDQIGSQVLIDDEWHVVHQLLQHGPGEMFVDFGYADYSIPLGILAWYEARLFGLSELMLRMPMLICGLVTLAAFPLWIAPRLSRATAVVFAALLALSPLMIVYSRIARPYAITLLFGWAAHAAFRRWREAPRERIAAAATYALGATLATWLHPLAAPFVLAPLAAGAFAAWRGPPDERRAAFGRLCALGLVTGAMMAALILPPLLFNPQSLAAKSGVEGPDLRTFAGVWYEWLGTGSSIVVVLCLALAALGLPQLWRALPEARSGLLGIALTLVAVLLARPMWSFNPLTLARYLLPLVPLLLLAVAAGAVGLARRVGARTTARGRTAFAIVAMLPLVALAATSPLGPMLRYPNAQALDSLWYMDFRTARNPIAPYQAAIPLSPFWATLAAEPAGSLRIAAAPFYFESYDWDAPRWEARSRQTVLPGFLTGLCVERRWGEVPEDARFRFENAVHLADAREVEAKRIDYVVWQKPYVRTSQGTSVAIGADTAQCEPALRARFGPPAYEDSSIIAFRVRR
jgi:4-amino-4-deoxy-L-arabinose transferase-like glycosyltransferase